MSKLLPVLFSIFAAIFGWLGKQDRIREEQQAEQKAEAEVVAKREEVSKLPDDGLDGRFERW